MKFDTAALDGDDQRIALEGRLDIDGTPAIDARLPFMATGRKGSIVVDLGGLSFLASIGIRRSATAVARHQAAADPLMLTRRC